MSRNPIRDWLKALGALVAANLSKEEAEARLAAFVPLLANEFDVAVFNGESLGAVGRACTFFPTFGELCERLAEWSKNHRPPPVLALPAPDGIEALYGMDARWYAYYSKRASQGFGPLEPSGPSSSRSHVLSLIRQRSPAAWRAIVRELGMDADEDQH